MIQIRTQKSILARVKYLHYFLLGLLILLSEFAFSQGINNAGNDDRNSWSLGVNISTFGPGVVLSKSLSNKVNLSAAYNNLPHTYSLNKLDDELEGDAKFTTGGLSLLLEYYPIKGIYFSGGIVYNQTKVNIDGIMSESVFIGDIEMYPDEVGTVKLDIEPEFKLAPYLGIGLGNIVPKKSKVAFSFEVGMLYLGEPKVDLHTTGMLEPTASVEQEQLIQDNISAVTFLPSVTFRLSFKLGGN